MDNKDILLQLLTNQVAINTRDRFLEHCRSTGVDTSNYVAKTQWYHTLNTPPLTGYYEVMWYNGLTAIRYWDRENWTMWEEDGKKYTKYPANKYVFWREVYLPPQWKANQHLDSLAEVDNPECANSGGCKLLTAPNSIFCQYHQIPNKPVIKPYCNGCGLPIKAGKEHQFEDGTKCGDVIYP